MNSENIKASDLHRMLFSFSNETDLKENDKYVALSNLCISYTCKKIKNSYKNNKFKISALTWNKKFALPERLHSVPDIEICFVHIFRKHEKKKKTKKTVNVQ